MVAIALGFVLPPLLRRPREDEADAQGAAIEVYRKRLDELKQDLERRHLSEAQYREARLELEAALAADLPALSGQRPARAVGRHPWTALALALAIPLGSLALYEHYGARREAGAFVAAEEAGVKQREFLIESATRLRAHLDGTPDDGQAWQLLGQTYLGLEEHEKAAHALAEAHGFLGDRPGLLVDYARALAATHGGRLAGRPAALLERALVLDPQHTEALWLSAAAALEAGRAEEARQSLTRLAALVPPGSDAERIVRAHIDQLGKPATAESAPPAAEAKLKVLVDLDPTLRGDAPLDATVFVFARAPQGPRMPLAVARRRVSELPLTVVLDDSQAMQPSVKLSSFREVVVGARVSRSGEPIARSGDLEGLTATPIALAGPEPAEARVTIDRVVP
jgi:cytochrome c-type biogenesis protein CcmH